MYCRLNLAKLLQSSAVLRVDTYIYLNVSAAAQGTKSKHRVLRVSDWYRPDLLHRCLVTIIDTAPHADPLTEPRLLVRKTCTRIPAMLSEDRHAVVILMLADQATRHKACTCMHPACSQREERLAVGTCLCEEVAEHAQRPKDGCHKHRVQRGHLMPQACRNKYWASVLCAALLHVYGRS